MESIFTPFEDEACTNLLLPIYIPTWLTPFPVVLKNTKSPFFRLFLLTLEPFLYIWAAVRGNIFPAFKAITYKSGTIESFCCSASINIFHTNMFYTNISSFDSMIYRCCHPVSILPKIPENKTVIAKTVIVSSFFIKVNSPNFTFIHSSVAGLNNFNSNILFLQKYYKKFKDYYDNVSIERFDCNAV